VQVGVRDAIHGPVFGGASNRDQQDAVGVKSQKFLVVRWFEFLAQYQFDVLGVTFGASPCWTRKS
jgi:hypothetical protein